MRAAGTFEVKMTSQQDGENPVGRMSIAKQFHGDLEASSAGQMLALMTETKGSAGYVAIEKVTGTLFGRTGTFALQHRGVMNRGAAELLVTVIPDSGTGELMGLAGTMKIIVEAGKHSYEFDYELTSETR